MLDSERFFEKLAQSTGNRSRVPIDVIWRTFQQLYPKLSISTEARGRLAELLRYLAQQEKLRLPKGKHGWDLGAQPPLPYWTQIFREKVQSKRPRMEGIAWPPELKFAASLKSISHQDSLLAIRDWLASGGRKAGRVPLKERSAEIFGDEKKLDRLLKTDLFAPGALNPDILRCYPVYPDLIWEKGDPSAPTVLIIENSNTYHSFCRWNTKSNGYAACVYGNGFMIHHTYLGLRQVLLETNPSALIQYFGDLDVSGIRIPTDLTHIMQKNGLPIVGPAEKWYEALLNQFIHISPKLRKVHPGEWSRKDLEWFTPQLRHRIEEVFKMGFRVPQEFVGTCWLQNILDRPDKLDV